MATRKPEISNFDALVILLLGLFARFGGQFTGLILHLAAMTAGVFGVLALVWHRVIASIALFPLALVFWWLGEKVHEAVHERTLDQVLKQGQQACDQCVTTDAKLAD